MNVIRYVCVFALLKTLSSAHYLDNVCQYDVGFLTCTFQSEGLYGGRHINKDVRRIEFDRLTNSRIDLSYFPSVDYVSIGSVLFDSSAPCQHIINIDKKYD